MKKVLVTLVLALTVAGVAQSNTTNPQPASPQQPATAQQPAVTQTPATKTIKDPVEYNEYIVAFNTQEPGERAKKMEAFLAKYPQTIMKAEALDFAMSGYQQAGNLPKAEEIANQIIAVNPDHYRALLIIAYAKYTRASAQTDPNQILAMCGDAETVAEHGLQVLSTGAVPDGVTKDDYDKHKAQIEPILHSIAGFCLLQKKEYQKARGEYLKSDLNDLQNAYRLALTELEPNPIQLSGFWHLVKAIAVAEAQNNTAGVKQIADYGQKKYKKYHGNPEGWDAFVAAARAQTALPSQAELEKLITRAPSPCEIAVQVVKDAEGSPGGVKEIAFPDKEAVLQMRECSPANKEAAEKVWNNIVHDLQKDGEAKVKLAGVKVIAVGDGTIDVALTEDNQTENKADIHVVLEKPEAKPAVRKGAKSTPPAPIKMPAVGSMTEVTGVFTSYTPDPFMFTMEKGELPAPAKPKPPVHKPAAKGKKKK